VRCPTAQGFAHCDKAQSDTSGDRAATLHLATGARRDIDLRFARRQTGVWKTYTHFDGLVHNKVNDLHLDRAGLLWVATSGGLSCFDGASFHNYTSQDGLLDDRIEALGGCGDGILWIASPGGLSRFAYADVPFDGTGFSHFTQTDCAHLDAITPLGAICCSTDGCVWIATQNGVVHYDGRSLTNYDTKDGLPSDTALAICTAADGQIWVGTDGALWLGAHWGGCVRYDQGKFTALAVDGQPTKMSILASASDHHGQRRWTRYRTS
jgi:ligand-binding sensor domain-containing protein